jgi:hypothetical protein
MVAIRKLIAQFHETRRRNNEIAAGLRRARVTPDQARMILAQTRDPQLENQAVDALRQYLSILHGREPDRQEMQYGIPNGAEQQLGMGVWPYVIMVGLGAAGSSVYSYFQSVAERERTAQMAMETPIDRLMRLAQENTTALTVAGAVGLGAYWYHTKQKEKREHGEGDGEEGEEPKKNPASITDRLKAAFGSKKEAAKENPDIFFRYDLEDFDADTLRRMADHLEGTAAKCDDDEGEEPEEEAEVEEVEEEVEEAEEPEEEAQEEKDEETESETDEDEENES